MFGTRKIRRIYMFIYLSCKITVWYKN